MDIQYSDQGYVGEVGYFRNVAGSMGVFRNVELGAGLSRMKPIPSLSEDGEIYLSANAKLQLPYIPSDWFTAAIGVQDVGAASRFESVMWPSAGSLAR